MKLFSLLSNINSIFYYNLAFVCFLLISISVLFYFFCSDIKCIPFKNGCIFFVKFTFYIMKRYCMSVTMEIFYLIGLSNRQVEIHCSSNVITRVFKRKRSQKQRSKQYIVRIPPVLSFLIAYFFYHNITTLALFFIGIHRYINFILILSNFLYPYIPVASPVNS